MNEQLTRVAKRHAVKVGEGSGVLIQPLTTQYSYVLTAKHVVDESDYPDVDSILIHDNEGNRIQVIERFTDSTGTVDLAVLKVVFQKDLDLGVFYGDLTRGMDVSIYGYPVNRRLGVGQTDEPSVYSLTLHDIQNSEILEFRNLSLATKNEIVGYSGCGIFYYNKDLEKVQLVGIENKMAHVDAIDGHICGYTINKVLSLVESWKLTEIKPPFLKSFSYSISTMFDDISLCEENSLNAVKKYLRAILSEYGIENSQIVTPDKIISQFHENLISFQQVKEDLHQPEMWIWFLEFVSVYLLLNQPDKEECNWESNLLVLMFQRFRVVYTHKPTNFRRLYREFIAPTNFSKISPEAKIIIFANGEKPPSPILDERLKDIPTSIAQGIGMDQIDTVRANQSLPNQMIHWPKLNDMCLAENENLILNINPISEPNGYKNLIEGQYGGVLGDD